MADQPCAEREGDFLKPEINPSKRNYAIECIAYYIDPVKKVMTFILEIQVIKDSTTILFEDSSVVYLTKSDKSNNKTVKTKLRNAVYTGLFDRFLVCQFT